MKKVVVEKLIPSIVVGAYFISVFGLSAQNNMAANYTEEEKKAIELMKKDGASEAGIDSWLMQQRLISVKEQNTELQNSQPERSSIIYPNSCSDMGAENGWSNWKGRAGTINQVTGAVTWGAWASPPPASNNNTAFTLTTGGGTDACTPAPGNPAVPVVAPGFGTRSIRLGVTVTPNAFCEQISFPLIVKPADTNFIYTYAIVLDNPADGNHVGIRAPHAEIYILDGTDTVPCSHQLYFGSNDNTLPPGFYQTNCNNLYSNAYKPWTTVGVNLTKYLGKTLTVVVSNYDCALGGHFCHSYWDFACPPITGTDPPYCQGNQTTLVAPPSDPGNPYTYTWYQNGTTYTGLPGATSVSITPTPAVGDTFAVYVQQSSGCNFWVPFIPQPMSINANFTSTGNCNSVSFTDASSTPDGTPVISWNWSFPGGTPSSSTAQNPSNVTYPPGTYTVTLIATSQAGCKDTIKLPVSMGNPPLAAFDSKAVCFNNPTVFNNSSTGTPPPTQWHWDFGNGNTSTIQNPSHTYSAPGSYTVTLIATDAAGCKDTIKHPVFINPLPTASFTSTRVCLGDTTCFTNTSAISSGTITGLSWNFGDPTSGSQNISNLSSPCHLYSAVGNYNVTLTVTSDSGCQSTIVMPVVFSPPPVALFAGTTGCLNVPTTLTSSSTSGSSDPINVWSWNFGDGSPNSSLTNPIHSYTTPGTFTVTLIVTTVQGCRDTVDHPVIIHAPPVANFSGPVMGCTPVCNNYSDLSTCPDGNIVAWQWSFPGGMPAFASSQNPQKICYSTAGSYGASLIITSSYGCKDSIDISPLVVVHPWPQAEFGVVPSIAPATDPTFNFNDLWSTGVTHWVWDFGDSSPLDSTNTDPAHSYSASATANDFYAFKVCLRVETQYGCWDTTCRIVELVPEFTFYIPNTVTPNGDGKNEVFFGKCRGVKEYNIWLFDRWGNLVWDCSYRGKNTDWDAPTQDGMSSFCQWDGKVEAGGVDMSGNSRLLAQEDVYVWKVRLTDIFDKKHTYIGHVSVVK